MVFFIYCSKQLYFWTYFMVLEKSKFDLEKLVSITN